MKKLFLAVTNTFTVVGYMLAALMAGGFASVCVSMGSGHDMHRTAAIMLGSTLLGAVFGVRRCMAGGKAAA